jgi:hypothetical protein
MMQVKCNLCGGENDVHPGQKMLFCAYCGSALALEEQRGPEHLILPHKRSDRQAEEALRSHLLSKNRGQPKDVEINFFFLPFLMLEDETGKAETVQAPGVPAIAGNLAFSPAGNYRFYEEQHAENQKIIPFNDITKGTIRILHLPVYQLTYRMGRQNYEATVIGESWQVLADELPPEGAVQLDAHNVLIAAVLFVSYLLIGKLASGWPARLFILLAAGTVGFVFYKLRSRVVKKA